MTLAPNEGLSDLAVINLVRNDHVAELSQTLSDVIASGQLIVNLRAEAAPELLREQLTSALAAAFPGTAGVQAQLEHIEAFKPGQPTPTHRDVLGSR
jgi:hypothetical protein